MEINSKYFREYRFKLGFSSGDSVKKFLAAKDLKPTVDFTFIETLNERLGELIEKLNLIVAESIKIDDINLFKQGNIDYVYHKLRSNDIIPKLNNQGRRPEDVYFSWMRGYIISTYFLKAISQIFNVPMGSIDLIGDDDLINIETFKRTPKADLQINLDSGEKIRIEVQSGFQGINDIKQHKVLEAKRIKREEKISSLVIHFDLFNGQVAFVKIDNIEEEDANWITRQQMEGQTVFAIDQNYFIWRLIDEPPKIEEITLD